MSSTKIIQPIAWLVGGSLGTLGLITIKDRVGHSKGQTDQLPPSPSLPNVKESVKSSPSLSKDNKGIDLDESTLKVCIANAKRKLNEWKTVNEVAGFVVGVSVRGHNVWLYGDGYADVENNVTCGVDTKMSIASISKSMTAARLAKLMQDGQVGA